MPRPGSTPWRDELDDFTHAFSGAFLFGTPLVYTMEMWHTGATSDFWELVALALAAYLVNIHLAYFSGFKRDTTFRSNLGRAMDQATDATAVGILAATIILAALNRISLGDPLDSVLGMIAIQAAPLSIGASVANALIDPERRGGRQGTDEAQTGTQGSWRSLANDVGATVAGGVFIGASIAPTQEIPLLAAELEYRRLLVVMFLSLALSYAIVFESGFSPRETRTERRRPFPGPLTETALAYAVSLSVALATLFLFGQVQWGDAPGAIAAHTVVLGLPVALGGAAGRLVI